MAGLIVTLGLWLVSLSLISLGVFYIYVKSIYRYFERRGIPYDRPTFPFGSFKSLVMMKRSYTLALADIYARHKHNKIVGYFSLWTKQILIMNPAALKNILIKDFEVFQNRGVYYNKEKDPLTAHLFTLEGNSWKLLREKLSPTFTSGKMKGMHSNFINCADILLQFINKSQSKNRGIDCQSVFAKYAQTVIASTAFGIESNSLTSNNSTFEENTKNITKPTLERSISFFLMFNRHVAKLLNIRVLPTAVSEYFLNLVKDTIKYRKVNKIFRADYLQQLIKLNECDSEGSPVSLTEVECAAQAFVFIFAGSDSTAATMSFCLYELSRHPGIQARLFRELDSLQDLSYDSINGCQYLDMVVSDSEVFNPERFSKENKGPIKPYTYMPFGEGPRYCIETLRKYPSVGFLNRECSRDYQVPDTDIVIEKGTQVLVSVHALQNDPDHFPDPELFNPERFSKENKGFIKPYTYMPFGEGPRYCIGSRFGLMVVKTGLASLIRRFHVCRPQGVSDTEPLNMEPRTLVTLVTGGLWIALEDRY